MLYGLLLHGATIGSNGFFTAISTTSDHFRMATFFLVSGFFTAMVLSRSELGAFLVNRGRLVLFPLVAGLLLLNPLTNWLIQLYHGGGIGLLDYFRGGWRFDLPGPTVWHLHLWFLISLFVYAMLTPLLLGLANSAPVAGLADRLGGAPPWLRLLVMTFAVALSVILLRSVNDRLVEPATPATWHFLSRATFNYFTYFAAGVMAFRHRSLFEAMHSVFWPGLLLFGGAYLLHPLVAAELPRALERTTYWLARAGFIFLIVCALLAIMRRLVTKGSPLLSRMTDGVYSFYIFHFLVIYIIANLMKPVTGNVYVTWAVIVLAGFPLLFLLHERVIAPSRTLTLLFNGKLPKRAVPA
jgi:glucan biosynthesis protein C